MGMRPGGYVSSPAYNQQPVSYAPMQQTYTQPQVRESTRMVQPPPRTEYQSVARRVPRTDYTTQQIQKERTEYQTVQKRVPRTEYTTQQIQKSRTEYQTVQKTVPKTTMTTQQIQKS